MSPWLRDQIEHAKARLARIDPQRLEIIRRKYANSISDPSAQAVRGSHG